MLNNSLTSRRLVRNLALSLVGALLVVGGLIAWHNFGRPEATTTSKQTTKGATPAPVSGKSPAASPGTSPTPSPGASPTPTPTPTTTQKSTGAKTTTNSTGGTTGGTPSPAPTANFQPSAPYFATFFYPWFKNPATDGSWNGSTWDDADAGGSHSPSLNWFSNYLPDPNPGAFDPATELYSSNNYTTFKWQMSKLVEAKQEIAISSWWGQGHKTDNGINKILTDFMARSDNPYPNLRWAFYYEKEGNVVNGTSDPSVATIAGELNYLKSKYGNSPYLLKINGKPVVFVYGDPSDGAAMAQRWKDANAQTGNAFYISLKVFNGFASAPAQPDSWHQYAPASRASSNGAYSYAISPGFWLGGDIVRLPRDLAAFQTAVTNMVNAPTTWRLVTTWNEWGEGTAVEPGVEVIQAYGGNSAVLNGGGAPFGNAYVQALADRLPALEKGTGR